MFLVVPLIEIYLLIKVGGLIGAGWTIFCVVFTAVLGAFLVRSQGFATLRRIQADLDAGALPAMSLLEGVCLLIAGALLLTPGFVTDAIGFACLTPVLRRAVIRYALERGLVHDRGRSGADRGPGPGPEPDGGTTVEGEYRRLDDET